MVPSLYELAKLEYWLKSKIHRDRIFSKIKFCQELKMKKFLCSIRARNPKLGNFGIDSELNTDRDKKL